MREKPLVYIVAGEPSGDLLAARLMAALRRRTSDQVEFVGIGGSNMQAQGLSSLFPMKELSVMGFAEVLPHIPHFLRRIGQTVEDVKQKKPDVYISVDAPGFSLRVSKRLKKTGIPLVHYVAPSVWAWKPKRAKKISAYLDHLLALLPFEPRYFTRHGLETTFVGHSALEDQPRGLNREECREELGLDPGCTTIVVLPGSRESEISQLGSIFSQTLSNLHASYRDSLQIVVPCVDQVSDSVQRLVERWPFKTVVCHGKDNKYRAFAAADVALAASGTVSLELAIASVPTVVGYRVKPLSAWIIRRFIKTRYYSLPNILLDEELQPERIQECCRPDILAADLKLFLRDPAMCRESDEGCARIVEMLSPEEGTPSDKAAEAVLEVIRKNQQSG
ncbi:lipid-A-disaccharide synthase [Kiloniella sp. b19]|uniref:lipid-A-disaccharide synthase n=1 Tax=Kiloniella sp. GXU_MW_B19 TaxID=3141326 RepID=UPI0031CE082F